MRLLGLALPCAIVLGLAAPAAADPVVVTSQDAVHAQPGRDYTRLATLRLGDHAFAGTVTATGKVVLQRYPGDEVHYTLFDPATGRRTSLPAPGRYPYIVEITGDTIWYSDTSVVKGRTTIFRYDRDTHRMRSFLLPEAEERQSSYVIGLDDDTIWYGRVRPREDHVYENVASVRFGRPATLEVQARHLGNPTFADGILAWTERGADFDAPGRVVLRDLTTGEITRTEMPAGCSQRSNRIQSNGSEFVVVLSCDNPEQKAIVVDRSGQITTILQVAMEDGALGTSDRGVFFYDTFYDFASGRLLDVSDIPNADIYPVGGPGEHPVQLWPQRDGRTLVVRLK